MSVTTNIAEGSKRLGVADYARFLNIAEGSLAETEYLILLGRDLGYVSGDDAAPLLTEASRIAGMLCALRTSIERRRSPSTVNCRLSTRI